MSLHSQNIEVSGRVTDTIESPLYYANIPAIPDADDQKLRFAVLDVIDNFK
ncbi:hypothetical protein [Subsaximicrobium wynnwilliamsii]|uniref:hypothetical protein n=1 Tax=Subsaximicrobium wynnwilliamsii TaxID=291179 RepID=UPI00167BFEC2|nr:hypothetical protein [Subsaximicrobium wynnwilliamsii]